MLNKIISIEALKESPYRYLVAMFIGGTVGLAFFTFLMLFFKIYELFGVSGG